MKTIFSILLVLAGLGGGAQLAQAQGGGFSLGLAAGKMIGAGGDYYDRDGFAFVAAISGSVRGLPLGLVTLGVDGSVQASEEAGFDDCLLVPGQTGCQTRFPAFFGLAIHAGWRLERSTSRWSVEPRVGLGPYWADGIGGAVLGSYGQIGVVRRLGTRWALELDGRATVLPAVRSRTIAIASLVLGVRWHSRRRG